MSKLCIVLNCGANCYFLYAWCGLSGEVEQTKKSVTAAASNTRSLRSRKNEEISKKTLPAKKGLKPAMSKSTSELPAVSDATVSVRSNTASPPQQVRTRSSSADSTKIATRHHSESALRTSTPVKSTVRTTHAVDAAGRSSSLTALASAADTRSKTQTVQDGVDSNRKIRSSRSESTVTSPVSTRSRSVMSSSPEKSSQDRHTHGVLWSKKTDIITYQRKHRVDKIQTRNNLRSTVSSSHSSTTADVDSSPMKRVRTHRVNKMQSPESSVSKTSSVVSDGEHQTGRSDGSARIMRKRRNVAVQADSQSSASSSRTLLHSTLHSTASSSAVSSKRRDNVIMESGNSGKTAVMAGSSQYDTCLESVGSQTADIDDEELDRLARIAHGSPQSAIVPPSSEDENITKHMPKKSHGGRKTWRSTAEQPQHILTFSTDEPGTVSTRQTAAVAGSVSDGSLDSDIESSAKRRCTKTDKRKETKCAGETSRATSELAADGDEKRGTDSVTVVSSQRHSERSGVEVSSSWVEKSSVEPVAGPSGLARGRWSRNVSKEKSNASSKN